MIREDPELLVYLVVLWIAFLGMMAFHTRHPVTRRSKALGAVTFVLLVLDASGLLRRLEV
jgi:hypothetical protein